MSIESKQYVVRNAAEIEKLTEQIIDADDTAITGKGTFLKALVATVQHELESPPRLRTTQAPKLSEEDTALQLEALKTVYSLFYGAVEKAVKSRMKKHDPEFLRSKTRFAVSAASTVRSYIRANNDIRALAAGRVTKAMIAVPRARRKFTVEALQRRATTLSEQLAAVAVNLRAANAAVADATFRPVLATLAHSLGMTEHATKDAEKAVQDHIALQTRTGVLVPIDFVEKKRKAA
jgi:hypothetical protein